MTNDDSVLEGPRATARRPVLVETGAVRETHDPAAERLIGHYRGETAGPTLLCVAGIHGNEPAGVFALRRVLDELNRLRPPFAGDLVGIAGNLSALACGQRYVDKDLNRQWRPGLIDDLRHRDWQTGHACEDSELLELRDAIHDAIAARRGPVYFVDLHTVSGRSAPFGVISDTLPNRAFALHFGVPIILGLDERVEGSLPEYVYKLGCVTLGFEAGRHDDPASIDLHEAAIWIGLHAAGNLRNGGGPPLEPCVRRLAAATAGIPRFLEIVGRYRIEDRAAFEMCPGFENFQAVVAGELVAVDRGAEVRVDEPACLFMPLYQREGDDGFFLARRVRPFWLKLSSLLRRLRLAAITHWLPGVRRHPTRPFSVLVHPGLPRLRATQLFHLLGFRRRRPENGRLVFTRRAFDVWQRDSD
jgi:succinylglutamate desuccinylase